MLTHFLSPRTFTKCVATVICCTLLQVMFAPFLMASAERSLPSRRIMQDGAGPRSGTLARNFHYPTFQDLSELPISISQFSGADVAINPGFDFFAIPVPEAGSSRGF